MAIDNRSINADPQVGQAVVDELKSEITKFGTICDDLVKPFIPLTTVNPDLGTDYLKEINQSALDIYQFLSFIAQKSADYFANDLTEKEAPPTSKDTTKDDTVVAGGGIPKGGGGDNGGGKSPKKQEKVTAPFDGFTPTTIAPQNIPVLETNPPMEFYDGTKIDLSKVNTKPLEEMPLSSLSGFNNELIHLAETNNKKLDEFVEDKAYAKDIKQMILNSPYVPDSFKEAILEMTDEEARQVIEAMLKGQFPDVYALNPLNLGIMYCHLQRIAEENGITVEELLTDPRYADLLKVTLKDLKDLVDLFMSWEELTPEEFQKNLSKLYDGNDVSELSETAINIVRTFIDYLSEETGIGAEELANDSEYAETLKEAALDFGKCATFFNVTSYFTDEGMRNNAMQMFDGTNYKALGLVEDEINGFKEEMDALAQENNTTAENLLTDPTYADKVKEALQNSENTLGVGNIFKNAESTVSQNVAKNLYNTDFTKENIISEETRQSVETAMSRTESEVATNPTMTLEDREKLIKRSESGLIDVSALRRTKP